jgi:hypothetical protein
MPVALSVVARTATSADLAISDLGAGYSSYRLDASQGANDTFTQIIAVPLTGWVDAGFVAPTPTAGLIRAVFKPSNYGLSNRSTSWWIRAVPLDLAGQPVWSEASDPRIVVPQAVTSYRFHASATSTRIALGLSAASTSVTVQNLDSLDSVIVQFSPTGTEYTIGPTSSQTFTIATTMVYARSIASTVDFAVSVNATAVPGNSAVTPPVPPTVVFGITGDLNYTHNQNSASATWVVNHNLGKRPSITVVDSAGDQCFGEVTYDNNNQVTIRFTAPFGGVAYLN